MWTSGRKKGVSVDTGIEWVAQCVEEELWEQE